jgi:hypothetical protein
VLELLSIGQTPDPVADKPEVIFVHHRPARRVLGRPKGVLDDLEDHIEGGQGEYGHHHAFVALDKGKPRFGVFQVIHQAAVELGLSVLVVADGGIELVHLLERHDRLEKFD